MELVRLLLLSQEAEEPPQELGTYEEGAIIYNLALMVDAGLVHGHIVHDKEGGVAGVSVTRLTWDGHDFLDSTKDPRIWERGKRRAPPAGRVMEVLHLARPPQGRGHRGAIHPIRPDARRVEGRREG